jgi:hypothetical protein
MPQAEILLRRRNPLIAADQSTSVWDSRRSFRVEIERFRRDPDEPLTDPKAEPISSLPSVASVQMNELAFKHSRHSRRTRTRERPFPVPFPLYTESGTERAFHRPSRHRERRGHGRAEDPSQQSTPITNEKGRRRTMTQQCNL